MRYIGSKQKLITDIKSVIESYTINGTILDAFSGTGVVSESFKDTRDVISCDIMHSCYVMTKCRMLSKENIPFIGLKMTIDEVFKSLNGLEPLDGFIHKTFTPTGNRKYFSIENGMKIDSILHQIYSWSKDHIITEDERIFLIGCLIESVSLISNTSGTYGAFNKTWDPRSLNSIVIKNHFELNSTKFLHTSNIGDCVEIIKNTPHDILYLDPPYNTRQYGSYYHVLETIVRNDNPTVKGVTGIRDWKDTKSKFCNKQTALNELQTIVKLSLAKLVILSYNNEGIMTKTEIEKILSTFGEVKCTEIPYARYNAGGSDNKKTIEYIFSMRRKDTPVLNTYENKIFKEDCIFGMKRIADQSIDMILTDLPYGLTECRWDSIIPLADLWKEYKRVIKQDGAIVLFGQQPFTSQLISSNYEMFKYSLIWKKSKAGNFAQAPYRFLCEHEDIVVFSFGKTAKNGKPRMKFNPQGTVPCNKVMKGKTGKTEHRQGRETQSDYVQTLTNYPKSILDFANEGNPIHPTQKPLSLCEYLIKSYTNEGDIILDSCMGSGTTAVASLNTNRKFCGFEIDETNYNLCIERLRKDTTFV